MIYMNVTAEDKNNVTALLKSDGKLNAVKYLHQRNYGDLKECLRYVNDISNSLGNNMGTITWISCEDHLPAIFENTELGSYSTEVFVTDKLNIYKSKFVRGIDGTPVGWFGQNVFGFTPTHFAYINLP